MEINQDIKQIGHSETVEQVSDIVNEKPIYQPDDLLTDLETTAYLRLAAGTMSVWRHESRGPPYYKVGRSVRYRFSDILQFLEDQRITP